MSHINCESIYGLCNAIINPAADKLAMSLQMDKSRQIFVILYLWKKNLGLKRIRIDMMQTIGPDAYSEARIAGSVQHVEQGDFLCKDESRPGRPFHSLEPALSRFAAKHPFSSA
jgi:hypothetical protein